MYKGFAKELEKVIDAKQSRANEGLKKHTTNGSHIPGSVAVGALDTTGIHSNPLNDSLSLKKKNLSSKKVLSIHGP